MITIRARQRLVVGTMIAGVVAAGCGHAKVADASPPQGDEQRTVSLTGVVEAAGDLARKISGKPQAAVRVVEVREVNWPSSALGCPGEGMSYADVLTPGYLVILEIDGHSYRYHAGRAGKPFLCPEGRAEEPAGRAEDVAY